MWTTLTVAAATEGAARKAQGAEGHRSLAPGAADSAEAAAAAARRAARRRGSDVAAAGAGAKSRSQV